MQRGHLLMLNRKLRKINTDGFTIIEVLIVLAIAGLILVIVFLAVPALERNARNEERKTDVANTLSGWSQFLADNNQVTPTGCAIAAGQFEYTGSSTEATTKLGIMKACTFEAASYNGTPAATLDTIYVAPGDVCNAAATAEAAGQATDVALLYYDETGNGTIEQCTGS
jgi:prepilin-type N-terminal cleavage/methylation domain-containing protein